MKSRIKRVVGISLFTFLLIATGLAFYAWLHWSPAGAVYSARTYMELPHRLRNSAEHDAARNRNNGNPYILYIDTEHTGALLILWSLSHT